MLHRHAEIEENEGDLGDVLDVLDENDLTIVHQVPRTLDGERDGQTAGSAHADGQVETNLAAEGRSKRLELERQRP